MYRNEKKYMIDSSTAAVISNRLSKLMTFDSNADENGYYRVTSLYFDDYINSALNDNIIGQMARKKYRIRVYDGNDSFIRLEKKIKHNKGGKKISERLTREGYEKILACDYESLMHDASSLLRGFAIEGINRHLKPKVIVDYRRQTFICEDGDVRITLDHDIQTSLGKLDLFATNNITRPAMLSGQVVMEVKYTGFLPDYIKDMIQLGMARQQSISKYTLCRVNAF